jgi:hypothetical protein
MESPPQLINTDDSPYETSSGPTTPGGSPLFLPAVVDGFDGKPLSHVISNIQVHKLATNVTETVILRSPAPARTIKNVCFVGAGYVGQSSNICEARQSNGS